MSAQTAKQTVVATSAREEVQVIVQSTATKSTKIRQLSALNCTRSEIALMLEIRYQHVRNVLMTKLASEN